MKILKYLLLVAIFTNVSYSQTTLFGNNSDIQIGGYGGPEVKMVKGVNSDIGALVGGKGAVVFNKTFAIGGGGWGMSYNDKNNLIINGFNDFNVDMGYGGIYLEYINNADAVFHFNTSLFFGWGGIQLNDMYNDVHYSVSDYDRYGSETFYVFEPTIQMEVNFFSWMKVAAGLSYRHFMSFDDYYGFSAEDFDGVGGTLTFKFGGGF